MKKLKYIIPGLALLVASVLLTSSVQNIEGSEIVVIVNKNNPVESLTNGTAKLYYLRKIKKRWPSINKNIKPVDRKGSSEERSAFLSKVLGMSSTEVDRYFVESQYRNALPPPAKFSSDAEIVEYVKNNQGAIGYVSKSAVTSDVKVVLTVN